MCTMKHSMTCRIYDDEAVYKVVKPCDVVLVDVDPNLKLPGRDIPTNASVDTPCNSPC